MEHLLQKSKCSIFHNIFKYMIFQRRQKELLWSKGLKNLAVSIKCVNVCFRYERCVQGYCLAATEKPVFAIMATEEESK